jgi:hypothetical protein
MLKFEKKVFPNLEGGAPRTHYICEETKESPQPFELIASGEGVIIRGTSPVLATHEALDDFALALSTAVREYARKRPKPAPTRPMKQMDLPLPPPETQVAAP